MSRLQASYGPEPLLDDVSLGIEAGDRIGVVGRNGGGKTTLICGASPAARGRHAGGSPTPAGCAVGVLSQRDDLDPARPVPRRSCSATGPSTSGPGDAGIREMLASLLGGLDLDAPEAGSLSGGERRRAGARQAAHRRARPDHAGRAHQPPRHRGHRLAGPAPARTAGRALRGRHPRPLVPRRGLHQHLGGRGRRGSSATRAATPPTCSPRPSGRGSPHAAEDRRQNLHAQGARLAAPRPARPHLQAASSGSTPPRR